MDYNPSLSNNLPFAARQSDLESILALLLHTDPCPNILVCGARGSGKTTLLLRAVLEIQNDPGLQKRYLPIVFSEECYDVLSDSEFWRKALFHLALQTYDPAWAEPASSQPLARLLQFAGPQRIMLVVENLDLLFNSQVKDAQEISRILMNEPRLLLLASVNSHNFDDAVMGKLGRVHQLPPLDHEQCRALWSLNSGAELTLPQTQALRILTRGNTRLLSVMARQGIPFHQLLDNLIALLDSQTPYLKSQIDNLPPTERKVFLALAELWNMAGARQIAAQAQLSVNSTSALLKRLSARGATLVSERGKRGRLYYIAEPLLSMYYLTRQQRRPHPRLKALVQFMIKFYDPAPLTLGAEREELLTLERGYDDFLTIAQTFAPVPPAVAGQSNERPPLNPVPEKIQGKLNNIAELFNKSLQLIQAANYEPALAAFDQIIDQGKGAPEPLLQEAVARALINKGVILGKLGKVQAEGQVYDEVLDRFKAQTSPALLQATAFALFNKGANLGKQGKIEEELAIYDEVRRRFGPCQDPGLQEQVAFALFNKASTLGELGKFEDSLQTYGQLITGFARRTPPTLQQAVARAFVNQSIILKELGRYDDELSLYQQIIAQFALRSEPELWAAAAFALYHSGVALGNLHRPYDALNVFADFITRFGEYPDARRITARALFNQAVLLGKLKKLPEAVQAYDQLLENFSDSPDLELRALAARAYINRGAALGELGRMEDEIASYDEIIEKLHREPEYRAIVEMACIRKCSAFMRSHEPQKAEQALLAVKGQRSLALQSKLIELWAQNPQKQDDAIKLTEAVISQHPADFSENAAWFFYKQNLQLNKCAAWARQAAAEPDSPRALGALACIAAALGRRQEALAAAEKFMQKLDAHNTYAWLEVLLELFINLAALAPREALALLADSPAAGQMEPLLTALKMSNEQDARTAPEIYDVALDIATRIERTRNSYFESRL